MVVCCVAPLQPVGEIHGSSVEPHGRGTVSRTKTSTDRAMATVSATEARKRLYALIDEVGQSHGAGADHRQAQQRCAALRGRLARHPGDPASGLDPWPAGVDPRRHGH